MINTFNKKELGVAVACALALGIFAATAEAQAQDGHAFVTSTTVVGECMPPARPVK